MTSNQSPDTPQASGPSKTEPTTSLTRLFKNSTLYAAAQSLLSVLSFVTDPILSHLLTVADFGVISLTRTLTNFQQNFYKLALDGAANRLFFSNENDDGARRRAIGTISTFLIGWTVVLTIAQEVFGPAVYRRLFDDLPYAPFGRIVAYSLLCATHVAITQVIWTAQERAKLIAGIRLATSLFSTAITFGLLLATNLGVFSVYASQVISTTILLVVHLRYSYRAFGFFWDTAALRRALAFGLPMVVHLTSHWALELADRLLLEKLVNRDAVGLYSVAYGTTGTLIMINGSVNSAYVPQFMKAYGKPGGDSFVAKAITYSLLVVSTATLGFVLFAPTIIRGLYAAKFVAAAGLTPILAMVAPFHALYLIHVNALFYAERTRIIPIFTFLAGAINIGLNLWWIPKFGIWGAAWATLLGYAALALLFMWGSRLALTLPLEGNRLARLFVTFVVIAAMAVGIDGRFPTAYEVLIKLGIALSAPCLLFATGFFTAEELQIVREKRTAAFDRIRKKWGTKPS